MNNGEFGLKHLNLMALSAAVAIDSPPSIARYRDAARREGACERGLFRAQQAGLAVRMAVARAAEGCFEPDRIARPLLDELMRVAAAEGAGCAPAVGHHAGACAALGAAWEQIERAKAAGRAAAGGLDVAGIAGAPASNCGCG